MRWSPTRRGDLREAQVAVRFALMARPAPRPPTSAASTATRTGGADPGCGCGQPAARDRDDGSSPPRAAAAGGAVGEGSAVSARCRRGARPGDPRRTTNRRQRRRDTGSAGTTHRGRRRRRRVRTVRLWPRRRRTAGALLSGLTNSPAGYRNWTRIGSPADQGRRNEYWCHLDAQRHVGAAGDGGGPGRAALPIAPRSAISASYPRSGHADRPPNRGPP